MKQGEEFISDGVGYRCLKDDMKLVDGKLAWQGQRPIKASTALKKKAIEKLAANSGMELPFESAGTEYDMTSGIEESPCVRETGAITPPTKRWFLQINELNFATYFSRGILAPAAWEGRDSTGAGRERDLQSYQPTCLVLLPAVFSRPDCGTVALEIALTDSERSAADKGAFYCLPGSLPISRLARIHFPESAGAPEHIHGRYVYPDVFIPKDRIVADFGHLPAVPQNEEGRLLDEIEQSVSDATGPDEAGSAVYDRLLGAVAMLRTAGYFFTQSERMFWEYPNALWAFLDVIDVEPEKSKSLASVPRDVGTAIKHLFRGKGRVNPLLTALRDSIYAGEVMNRTKAREIAADIYSKQGTPDAVTKALRLLFKEDDYRQCIKDLSQSSGFLPYLSLAYLFKFHKKDSNDPVNALAWVGRDLVDDNTASYVLGLLGAYYGYSKLNAFVDVEDMDPVLKRAAGGDRLPVKFGPRNVLESIILEHAHKLAFPGYEVCEVELASTRSQLNEPMPTGVEDLSCEVAGTRIAVYRKLELADIVADLLRSTYPARIRHHQFVIATCIAQLWPDYGDYPCLGPYDRDEVCQRLHGLSDRDLDRVRRHIEFDRKENIDA